MRTIIQRRREQELASAGGDNLKQLASLLHTDNKTVHGGTEQSNGRFQNSKRNHNLNILARPTLLKLEEPMDNIPMSLDRPLVRFSNAILFF
jgi:hypothetical protein